MSPPILVNSLQEKVRIKKDFYHVQVKKSRILFQDNPKDIRIAGKFLMNKLPIIQDYGSTFGTTFITDAREQIARLRKESLPLRPVSIITTYQQALDWINLKHIHPFLHHHIENHLLLRFEGISFIRLPANDKAKKDLGKYYINKDDEIQIFIVPDSDPLLSFIQKTYRVPCLGVRSSNIEGEPEEYTPEGAIKYSSRISASGILFINKENLTMKPMRKRIGSQPIIRLPKYSEKDQLTLVRSANTHPDAIKKLVIDLISENQFLHIEEKIVKYRHAYNPLLEISDHSPDSIRKALMSASGL